MANGTPSARALPPRAGRAVRTTPIDTSPLLRSDSTARSPWGSELGRHPPSSPNATDSTSSDPVTWQQTPQRALGSPSLLGSPMSQHAASPPSRAPSSASSSSLARVHGHDHTRPLPPPRLHEANSLPPSPAPITLPLAPLGSFRTRTSRPDSRTTPTTTTTTTTTSVSEVTLTVPRPDGERALNEYVETPFRPSFERTHQQDYPKCPKAERRLQQQRKLAQARHNAIHRRQSHSLLQSSSPTSPLPVTKQPVSFTKEPSASLGSGSLSNRSEPPLSIMCDYCGKCRCESCREPPPLPSRWLCHNNCFCSAETALDYASCLCCAKGLFYHCGDSTGDGNNEGGTCADEPCSCTGNKKAARWACLGALTLVLPCLLCYWPLKGCVTVCETCYARHAAQGCRCDPSTVARQQHTGVSVLSDSRDPEKRLLDPITPEL